MKSTAQLLLLVTCGAAFASSLVPEEQTPLPTTFFIVRHAEKDAQENLNAAGIARAKGLRDFLIKQPIHAVYSTDYARTIDTAAPTATALNLSIQKYNARKTDVSWGAELLKKHAGQNVLIVGHSNTVLPTVKSLGAKMNYNLAYEEYHNLFIVRVQSGAAQAVRVNYGNVPSAKKPASSATRQSKTKVPVKP